MTPRERWLAALCLQPVDRLPFWPKLGSAYPDFQDPPFDNMTLGEVHDYVGSDLHQGSPSCIKEIRPNAFSEESGDDKLKHCLYHVPSGELCFSRAYSEASRSWHPVRFPVKTVRDLSLMAEWYEGVRLEPDFPTIAAIREAKARLGDRGVTSETIGTSPIMHFVQMLAGVENAQYLLADHPREVEALFDVMSSHLLKRFEIAVEHSPADLLYLSENTSTTLISPEQYRKYCAPIIGECARLAEERGRTMVLHMCGHLKALLPQLAQLTVAAFESFTSPTLGDTTLLHGRQACPDKCLIGGTNATLWTQPAGEIIDQLKAYLDALPHHRGIVVTSAGAMPPGARPETIREVCQWVRDYKVRN